jgi:RHS repeat-associated protein
MQLASGSHIPDGLLAANVLLSEKPRHGVASKNPAPNQGINEANSTAAIGLRASLLLNRVQSRYTGKERDAESGLDNFGARYYASSMGRWMSPDWSANPEAVPYSSLGNPQSLNLYGYVNNNPLSHADRDGHEVPPLPDSSIQKISQNLDALGHSDVAKGILGLTGVVLLAPEIGAAASIAITTESLAGTAGVGVATLGATGTAVNSTAQIVGGLTKTNTEEATDHVTSITNPVAASVGLVTGSAHAGAQAADLTSVGHSAIELAKTGSLKNPAETANSLGGAIDAAKSAASFVSNVAKSFFTPPPPPPKQPQ